MYIDPAKIIVFCASGILIVLSLSKDLDNRKSSIGLMIGIASIIYTLVMLLKDTPVW